MNSIVTIVGVCLLAAIGEGVRQYYSAGSGLPTSSRHDSGEKNFYIRCSFENLSENSTEQIQLVKIDDNTKAETILFSNLQLLVNDTNFQLTKEIDGDLIDVSYLRLKFLSTRPSDSGTYECRKIGSDNKILKRDSFIVVVDPKPVKNDGFSEINLDVCERDGCMNRVRPWKPF